MNNTELLYQLMEMCYVQKEDEYGGVDWILDKNRVKLIQIVSDKIKESKKEHELLGLYQKLSKELNLEIVIGCDSWDGIYAFETLECKVQESAIETFKQIKELEEGE